MGVKVRSCFEHGEMRKEGVAETNIGVEDDCWGITRQKDGG